MPDATPISRPFYDRDPLVVAPELLGKVFVRGARRARIVEVEAYRGESDPASHAYGGLRPRCATMFGPPGHLYVYFTYGMHYCANVVCSPSGVAGAVLLRAMAPLAGLDEMRLGRRNGSTLRELQLLSGPARLCQGFGIDRSFDGADLTDPSSSELVLVDDGTPPPVRPEVGPRVGLGVKAGPVAAGQPWRFSLPGDPHVSRWTAGGRGRVR